MRRWVAWFTTLILLVPVVAVAAPDWFTQLDGRVVESSPAVDCHVERGRV